MSDLEDFEDFDSGEKAVKPSSKKKAPKQKTAKQMVEEPILVAPAPIPSAAEFETLKQQLYGAKNNKIEEEDFELNIDLIGQDIHRLSTLYYPTSFEFYKNRETLIDYYDGTYHIREFEKNCSIQQLKTKQLISFCDQNEKDKQKRMNKDRKKEQIEVEAKEEHKAIEFNIRRDLNGDKPYPPFKEALEESNPLNGFEFYDELYRNFCNQLDQSTAESHIVEKIELPKRKEPAGAESATARKGDQNRTASHRRQSFVATNNSFEITKSPMHPSPSNLFDSFYSINDSHHRRFSSFQSRDEEKKPGEGDASPRRSSKKANSELLKKELEILNKFNGLLEEKAKLGKLRFGARTSLNRSNSSAAHPIFKYDSISQQEDLGELNTLNKRVEKEVFLDYDLDVNGAVPVKILKNKAVADYNYSNLDLVFSSWYDAIIAKINGEETGEAKKLLLIDLNDKSVFYSKLMSMLSEKSEPEEPQAAAPDPNFASTPNQKILEKIINKTKKDMRITIAKRKGGNELDDRARDEGMNEEDLKFMNIFSQPNPVGNHLTNIFGTKNIQISKLNHKRMRKITNYHHSEVANNFQFNIFEMSKDKIKHLHRFDISKVVYADLLNNRSSKWSVKVLNNCDANYPLKKQLNRKRKGIADINMQEIHHSQEIFKRFQKLSLRADDFFLFEYIEKNPLILSNVGMASRLTKYYYPVKIMKKIVEEQGLDGNDKEVVTHFRSYLKDKLGEHGEEFPLEENDHLPTLGQLVGNKCGGLTILENNLFRVPVFKQKARKNDFVLVRCIEKGEVKYYLRKIKAVYVAGQIQPKSEVFCPYSRQFRSFLKKLLKFCINKSFEDKRSVHLRELKNIFPTMNDFNLRKNIKMLGGEQDPTDNKFYTFNQQLLKESKANDYADEIETSIIPEELCLYERMYQTFYDLTDFGITKLKSSDKISVIKTKFYRNNLDSPEKCAIARRIIQELMLTSWNLSQSFISAIQTQGRMYLTGYGDPTNGHGGMNFIKLPLKISRYESQLFRKAKKGKPNQMVTGTCADLRRLPMVFVHDTLKKFGYTEDTLATLERWDKIELLREISNKQQGDSSSEDLRKFQREIRMTTKMQKEKYQNDINDLLMGLIQNLTVQNWDEIDSDDEMNTTEDITQLIWAEEKEITKYRNLNSEEEDEQGDGYSSGSDEDGDNSEGRSQDNRIAQGIEADIRFD